MLYPKHDYAITKSTRLYVEIPGYHFVYKNREQKCRGGVGAYLKE